MRRLICLLVLSLLVYVNISFADEKGAQVQQSQSVSGTGKVLDITHRYVNTGGYKEPEKGDPLEMAYQFLELNREKFHITNPRQELVYKKTMESKLSGTKRVDFEQVYQGVPVLYGGFKIVLNRNGEIEGIGAKYYYDIDLSTTPQIDSATAENLALKDLGFPKDAKIVKYRDRITRLTIWRSNQDKFHLIWLVRVSQEYPKAHAWKYYIDAHDGSVLEKADEMIWN